VIFSRAEIDGAWIVDIEPRQDERGFFARSWCRDEFAEHGLDPVVAQESVAFNTRAGTLRGMHYLRPPRAETKLVRCLRGSVYAVMLDLRPDSPSWRRWQGLDLTGDSHRAIYLPATVALGYLTLEDASEIGYWISERHSPEGESGVRWDDPAFAIRWPAVPGVIAARDREWPLYDEDRVHGR
jgi:dTDP-4-dehydrorhamnose 3,5-epimerase